MTAQSTADLWATIVGTTYQESVLAYGNMHSNHGPEDDEHLPEGREAARYVALTALSAATGVPAHTISLLASRAADAYGHAPDADYHDYLAEPDWDAVRDGTYEPRDPWADVEPDEEDDVPADEYRVRVWSSRRVSLGPIQLGRWGWRVQIDYLSLWDEHGDMPLLCEWQHWFPTQDQAINFGLTEARSIHDDGLAGRLPCLDLHADLEVGPLVVHVGGWIRIDERTEVAP